MTTVRCLACAALCIPAVAAAGDLGADSPLSAWRAADVTEKHQLVGAMARQLQAGAASAASAAIPYADVIHCVDDNRTPDQLQVRDRIVDVTSGMATVLCLKIHVASLRAAKYRLDGAPVQRP